MTFGPVFGMWLAMTAVMMAPVVYPWLRALRRITADDRITAYSGSRAGLPARPEAVHPFARVLRSAAAKRFARALRSSATVIPFAIGYALTWAGFSALAASVQLILSAMALPVPFAMDAPVLSAAALGLAGTFQLTRLKEACLSHCRSPAGFLLTRWRPGTAAAARLGLEHGLYCVGCCWALMALALAVGMIDLLWMGLLMAVMVAETTLPFGARLTRPVGVALLAAGAALLVVSQVVN